MIQPVQQRLEHFRNIRVIDQPSQIRICLAFDSNFDLKAVSMQSAALMGGWQMREQMRRFKLIRLAKLDPHFAAANSGSSSLTSIAAPIDASLSATCA